MLAVDTNVVVRFLADDNAGQHKRAIALFRAHAIWLSRTVLLEAEWVLRGAFGFAPLEIGQAFQGLTRLPNVHCEDGPAVQSAIEALVIGMDFADALHLAGSRDADEGFASFDSRFVRQARKHWPGIAIRMA